MICELDRAALTESRDTLDLKADDIGTVVLIHEGGRGYEVEFVTLTGNIRATPTPPRLSRRIGYDRSIATSGGFRRDRSRREGSSSD